MKEIVSGDILLAREAVAAIDVTDLSPTIEIPPIPADTRPENISEEERMWLRDEIAKLKKERNALILAHNYMPQDVQDVADVTGDSLYLAKVGSESSADVLLEAAVLFMNQILAAKKKPHQIVLMSDPKALCSLAAHADVEKIRLWKAEHPNGVVIMYVNTYIEVKAESDFCCASANSPQVIEYVAKNYPDSDILFGPDIYLGLYAAKMLLGMGLLVDRLWLQMGACHVHEQIRPGHLQEQQRLHPDAVAVGHMECGCQSACLLPMVGGAENKMRFLSTQQMVKFAKETSAKKIIVATEVGNIYPMSKAAPDKIFIPASAEAICPFMKQNTLRKIYNSLKNLVYEVNVDPELGRRAMRAIDNMLRIV